MSRVEQGRSGFRLAVAGLVLGVGAGVAAGLWSRRDPAPPPAATAAPISVSPGALAAYKEGLGHLERGLSDKAVESFRSAVAQDPELAAAYLRLATTQLFLDSGPAREAFQQAVRRRASLDERDREILQGVEPLFLRDPSDWVESARRLQPLAKRYPDELVIQDTLYGAAMIAGSFEDGLAAAERQIARRAQDHQAWFNRGNALAYLGDFEAARASFRRCLELSPDARFCHEDLAWIATQLGPCEDLEAVARGWLDTDGKVEFPHIYLASVSAVAGKPVSEVRSHLERVLPMTREVMKPAVTERNATWIAVLQGDFTAAREHLAVWEKAAVSIQTLWAHTRIVRLAAGVALEMGRPEDAAKAAHDYLEKKGIWLADATIDDVSLYRDATPDALGVLRATGKLDAAAATARRRAWFDEMRGKVSEAYVPFLWMHAYPPGVLSAEEAQAAIAALPAGKEIPPFRPLSAREADIGRMYLLAGRPLDAIRWLRASTAACRAVEEPLVHVQGQLWLGMALEAAGEKTPACGAYRKVIDRWGKARPRSVTAEEAQKRIRDLGCP